MTPPEQTLELAVLPLIPGIARAADGCVPRLVETMQAAEGIRRVHVEDDREPQILCLHYDPAAVSADEVRRLTLDAGKKLADLYGHEILEVDGLDCSDCVQVIEHGLSHMQGLVGVQADYSSGVVHVEYERHHLNRKAIERRLGGLGYPVRAEGLRKWAAENRELIYSLTAGVIVLFTWLAERFFQLPAPYAIGLFLLASVIGGYDIARHTIHHLRERHFDTDLLMLVAAFGAFMLGEFFEGALLLFLFSLGHALEETALERARGAVRSLANYSPKTARVRRGSAVVEVGVDSVGLDEEVVIPPGVRIPVDGIVIAGESAVDQAPVTGESIPVEKFAGSTVFAGTVNGSGGLEVRVTRLAKDSTLRKVMRLVEEAQDSASPTQISTEKFMRRFVPAVLIADVLLILVPPLFGVPFSESFRRAMTMLVAASPCALALGTPSAILAGVGRAARGGVLLKGGVHLENLGRLKAIAFDKTGTITTGRPELTDLFTTAGWSDTELLATSAALETRSAHPLAQAVARAAERRSLPLPEVGEVKALVGRGIEGCVDNRQVLLGSIKLFDEKNFQVSEEIRRRVAELEEQGKTVMLAASDGQIAGGFAVSDALRPETVQALSDLKRMGLQKTVLLSGDENRVAQATARLAGVDQVFGGLMPQDKLDAVRDLVRQHTAVAMVGDGVNDAPALAAATVGVAMGGAGSDVALETADIALMSDDLSQLPFAVGLGRASGAVIRQNLAIALGVIGMLIAASVTGWVGLGAAVALHEGSTIAVVLNSLRLLNFNVKH